MQNNLATLANVKAWLGITTVDDNFLLDRLIASASRAINAYLARPNLLRRTLSEVYDGPGGSGLMLRQWPVLSVAALSINGRIITPSASFGQPGYSLVPWDGAPPGGPQMLNLTGHAFCRGFGTVGVTYTAGYAVQDEPHVIPATSVMPVTALEPYGSWAGDSGVTFADGTPLTAVASGPAAGQYAVDRGAYTFSTDDAGKTVLISYSFIPADIEQACIEIVGERYKTRDRIGQASKSLGGQETVSFITKSMNDTVAAMLQPYRMVVPC